MASAYPLGYADDIATASASKNKTDRVLQIVYEHSCKWRYVFNPKKSAVLVYGENDRDHKWMDQTRTFYSCEEDAVRQNSIITKPRLGISYIDIFSTRVWSNLLKIGVRVEKIRRN